MILYSRREKDPPCTLAAAPRILFLCGPAGTVFHFAKSEMEAKVRLIPCCLVAASVLSSSHARASGNLCH